MKPLNPNSMIQGRYLIVQPIGKGGMGEVYLAVDQRLGSAVALKRTFFSEDSMLGTAFEREARILARLRHPVLPKVIDHFAENGDQFLVMEHISGDDIAKRLEVANKPFPVSWVMFWADQMLDALSYLHSHEPPIVHRDIKPQNLKLTDDNHIVLLDFGLSKDFDSTASGLNSASVAGYSPHFASMEQIRGTGTDARSDLYSLAATLYQMLANVVPPDALTRADARLGGKPDPIAGINELNPEVPKAISDVILKAVSIRQDERYASAPEMQKALRRAFNQEKGEGPTTAEPAVPSVPPVVAAVQPQVVTAAESKPAAASAEQPEMETRIRTEAPVPLDATMKMDKPPGVDERGVKASEQKTAVFNSNHLESVPPGVASQPETAKAVAASSSAAASPSQASPNLAKSPGKKKSSAGIIIGVLATIGLVVGVGGGAAWYLSRQSSGPAPSPTPTANTKPSDSPPPTTPNANVQGSTNVPTNTSGQQPTVPEVPSNTVATKTPPVTPPKNTAVKTPPPAANKAPGKTKEKDDRTVIVQ